MGIKVKKNGNIMEFIHISGNSISEGMIHIDDLARELKNGTTIHETYQSYNMVVVPHDVDIEPEVATEDFECYNKGDLISECITYHNLVFTREYGGDGQIPCWEVNIDDVIRERHKSKTGTWIIPRKNLIPDFMIESSDKEISERLVEYVKDRHTTTSKIEQVYINITKFCDDNGFDRFSLPDDLYAKLSNAKEILAEEIVQERKENLKLQEEKINVLAKQCVTWANNSGIKKRITYKNLEQFLRDNSEELHKSLEKQLYFEANEIRKELKIPQIVNQCLIWAEKERLGQRITHKHLKRFLNEEAGDDYASFEKRIYNEVNSKREKLLNNRNLQDQEQEEMILLIVDQCIAWADTAGLGTHISSKKVRLFLSKKVDGDFLEFEKIIYSKVNSKRKK